MQAACGRGEEELSGWGRKPRGSRTWGPGSPPPKRAPAEPGEPRSLSELQGKGHGAAFLPVRFWEVVERSQVSLTCFQGLGEPAQAFPGSNRENKTALTGSGEDGRR